MEAKAERPSTTTVTPARRASASPTVLSGRLPIASDEMTLMTVLLVRCWLIARD
jgi:hypothetical protein